MMASMSQQFLLLLPLGNSDAECRAWKKKQKRVAWHEVPPPNLGNPRVIKS
jgi:hypothetical protein